MTFFILFFSPGAVPFIQAQVRNECYRNPAFNPEFVMNEFIRGDSDDDCNLNLADPIITLRHLFSGGPAPECKDAADANDDGTINLADAVYTLNHLFLGGPEPPKPFDNNENQIRGDLTPGTDPTLDALDCCGMLDPCPAAAQIQDQSVCQCGQETISTRHTASLPAPKLFCCGGQMVQGTACHNLPVFPQQSDRFPVKGIPRPADLRYCTWDTAEFLGCDSHNMKAVTFTPEGEERNPSLYISDTNDITTSAAFLVWEFVQPSSNGTSETRICDLSLVRSMEECKDIRTDHDSFAKRVITRDGRNPSVGGDGSITTVTWESSDGKVEACLLKSGDQLIPSGHPYSCFPNRTGLKRHPSTDSDYLVIFDPLKNASDGINLDVDRTPISENGFIAYRLLDESNNNFLLDICRVVVTGTGLSSALSCPNSSTHIGQFNLPETPHISRKGEPLLASGTGLIRKNTNTYAIQWNRRDIVQGVPLVETPRLIEVPLLKAMAVLGIPNPKGLINNETPPLQYAVIVNAGLGMIKGRVQAFRLDPTDGSTIFYNLTTPYYEEVNSDVSFCDQDNPANACVWFTTSTAPVAGKSPRPDRETLNFFNLDNACNFKEAIRYDIIKRIAELGGDPIKDQGQAFMINRREGKILVVSPCLERIEIPPAQPAVKGQPVDFRQIGIEGGIP